MNSFPAGSDVVTHATFKVAGTTLTDPGTVTFEYMVPGASTWTSKVYLTDPEVSKVSTGTFEGTVDVSSNSGVWKYRFVGTSPAKGASPIGTFRVYEGAV